MEKKRVLIIGDSYSTFRGYIPENCSAFYSPEDERGTGLDRVEQTWWYPIVTEEGYRLVMNNSYSGSTFCNTGYEKKDVSQTSFLGRLDNLVQTGFFAENKIDCVMVFGGTNDDWAQVPIAPIIRENWTAESLYSYGSAVFCFFHRLREILPDAQIFGIVNSGLREEIRSLLLEACERNRVRAIQLTEVEKVEGHPTVKGMLAISRQVRRKINL